MRRCVQVNDDSLAAVADRFHGSLLHIPRCVTKWCVNITETIANVYSVAIEPKDMLRSLM